MHLDVGSDSVKFSLQDPNAKEEVLQEIFDALELLRESNMLTPCSVSFVANMAVTGLSVRSPLLCANELHMKVIFPAMLT